MAYTGNLIPTMTSNTAPYGIASASSENAAANAAWAAMDKSNTTFWRSTSAGKANCNLAYLFILPQVIDSYSVTASTTTNTAPNSWKFQGRNVTTWTDLDTQASKTFTSNEKKTYTFTNSTAYQEYRILVSVNNGGTYTEIAEIEMHATISGSVKVVNERLQVELAQTNPKIAGHRLNVEALIPVTKIAGYTLQVEFAEGTAPTSRLKYWDGAAWTACPLKINDSGWVEKTLKYYNAGTWE